MSALGHKRHSVRGGPKADKGRRTAFDQKSGPPQQKIKGFCKISGRLATKATVLCRHVGWPPAREHQTPEVN